MVAVRTPSPTPVAIARSHDDMETLQCINRVLTSELQSQAKQIEMLTKALENKGIQVATLSSIIDSVYQAVHRVDHENGVSEEKDGFS